MNEEQFVSFLNSRKKDTNFRKISLVQLFVYPEVKLFGLDIFTKLNP